MTRSARIRPSCSPRLRGRRPLCAPTDGAGVRRLGPRGRQARPRVRRPGPHLHRGPEGQGIHDPPLQPDLRARRRGPVGRRPQRRRRQAHDRARGDQVGPRARPDGRHPGLAGLGPDGAQVLLHRDRRSPTRSGSATPPTSARSRPSSSARSGASRRSPAQGRGGPPNGAPPDGRRRARPPSAPRRESRARSAPQAGRQLRRHRHRRPDALSGPVGRVRRGPDARRRASRSATSSDRSWSASASSRARTSSSPGTAPAGSSTPTRPTRTGRR